MNAKLFVIEVVTNKELIRPLARYSLAAESDEEARILNTVQILKTRTPNLDVSDFTIHEHSARLDDGYLAEFLTHGLAFIFHRDWRSTFQ